MIPVNNPSQDTNEHTISDESHQQPLYYDSGGQTLHPILLSQLEMETQAIASFSTEFPNNDRCQPSDDPPPIPPSVCNHSNIT